MVLRKRASGLIKADCLFWKWIISKLGWARFGHPAIGTTKARIRNRRRTDILTIPDLIDFDEGRFPEASESP